MMNDHKKHKPKRSHSRIKFWALILAVLISIAYMLSLYSTDEMAQSMGTRLKTSATEPAKSEK